MDVHDVEIDGNRFEALEKKLQELESLLASPMLFVSDYFFSVRNQVDLEAETKLQELSGASVDVEPTVASWLPRRPTDGPPVDAAVKKEQIDAVRMNIIRELKNYESLITKRLELESLDAKKTEERKATNNVDLLLDFRRRLEAFQKSPPSSGSTKAFKDYYAYLLDWYRLESELEREIDRLKSGFLAGKSVCTIEGFFNDFSMVVLFEDIFLNSKEIDFISSASRLFRTLISDIFEQTQFSSDDYIDVPRTLNRNILYMYKFLEFLYEGKPREKAAGQERLFHIYEAVRNRHEPPTKKFKRFTKDNLHEDSLATVSSLPVKLSNSYCMESLELLELSNLRISEIDAQTFKLCENLKEIKLALNELTRLPAGVFDLADLRYLNLSSNLIRTIDTKALDNLASLVDLNLSGNYLQVLDEGLLRNLKSLHRLHLNANYIEKIPARSLDALGVLTYLDLSDNHLGSLETDTFKKLVNLKVLLLASNFIERLDSALYSTLKNLATLSIDENKLTVVASQAFKTLNKLKDLAINSNLIDRIEDGAFENLGLLESLSIYNNRIKSLGSQALKGLVSLKKLDVSANQLERLDAEFADLLNVESISLDGNRIRAINAKCFDRLGKLWSLALEDNLLTRLEPCQFQYLDNLVKLNLHQNNLGPTIDPKSFQGLNNLKQLILDHNLIESLDEFAFVNLTKLESLDLHSNQIRHVSSNAFNCLFELKKLVLSLNKIERIEDKSFECLSKLDELSLDNNALTHIGVDTFNGLSGLTFLFLSGNRLTQLDDACFRYVNSITQLYLGSNLIAHIAPETFKHFRYLFEIDLSDNRLASLENKIEFPKMLTDLNLRSNRLERVQIGTFDNLADLTTLNLSENRLVKLYDNGQSLFDFQYSLKSLYLSNNYLTSINEDVFSNLGQLEELDLSFNYIDRIDSNAFRLLTRLSDLHLVSNYIGRVLKEWLVNCTSLRRVDLASNTIDHVDTDAFGELIFLHNLSLADNKIERLSYNCFHNILSHMYSLNMQKNFIRKISDVLRTSQSQASFRKSKMRSTGDQTTPEQPVSTAFELRADSESLDENDGLNDVYDIAESDNYSYAKLALDLSHNLIEAVEDDDLAGMTRVLSELDLSFNKIRSLATNAFAGLRELVRLNLTRNHIQSLDLDGESVFNSLVKLEELSLEMNEIGSLSRGTFRKLERLSKLNLGHNQLETLDDELFRNLYHLEVLRLHNNKLRTIDSNKLLIESFKLVHLDLRSNQIERLDRNLFAFNTALKHLYLQDNRISFIDVRAFCGLTHLSILDLSSNRITSDQLTHEHFAEPRNLMELYLTNNELTKLDFTRHLLKLYLLNLQKNRIGELDAGSFVGLVRVNEINLSQNSIRVLDSSSARAFNQHLKKLVKLDLSSNQLERIEPREFENLVNLNRLNLSENKLKRLDSEWFYNLSRLVFLNLSSNLLTDLVNASDSTKSPFRHLGSLEDLRLEKMSISALEAKVVFRDLLKLKKLTLRENKIERLDDYLFEMNANLDEMDLSRNLISKIASSRVFSSPSRLKSLNLSLNQLDETLNDESEAKKLFESLRDLQELKLVGNKPSRLRFLHSKLQLNSLNTLNLSEGNLSDAQLSDGLFENQRLLEWLSLASNQLRSLRREWFRGMDRLSHLDLSKNQIERLEERQFEPLVSLEDLELPNNKLTDLDFNSVVSGLTGLNRINLSENCLERVVFGTGGSDACPGHLYFLELKGNKLKEIDIRSLARDYGHLERLDLSSNRMLLSQFDDAKLQGVELKILKKLILAQNDFVLSEQSQLDAFARCLNGSFRDLKSLIVSFKIDESAAAGLSFDSFFLGLANLCILEQVTLTVDTKAKASVKMSSFNGLFRLRSIEFNGCLTEPTGDEYDEPNLLPLQRFGLLADFELTDETRKAIEAWLVESMNAPVLENCYVSEKAIRLIESAQLKELLDVVQF